jgi:hypothetical protein
MRFQMLLEQMGRISVLATTARLLMLWAPPILYIFIFLPCWECFDFEAAAAHEVGHALGLMHPDQAVASGTNLRWSGVGDGAARAAPCDDPWSAVVAAPPDASVAPSIMLAFTQFNKGVCLSQDDLDALNTLYPLCDHRVATPQCYKTESYIGLMRLGVLVGLPVIIFLLLILVCHWSIDVWEDRQHDRLQDKLQESELKMSALEEKLRDAKAYKKHAAHASPRKWKLSRRGSGSVRPASPTSSGRSATRSGGAKFFATALKAKHSDPAQPTDPTCCGKAAPPAARRYAAAPAAPAAPLPLPSADAPRPQPASVCSPMARAVCRSAAAPQQAAGGGLAPGPSRAQRAALPPMATRPPVPARGLPAVPPRPPRMMGAGPAPGSGGGR